MNYIHTVKQIVIGSEVKVVNKYFLEILAETQRLMYIKKLLGHKVQAGKVKQGLRIILFRIVTPSSMKLY